MVQYVFRDRPLTIKNGATANPQKIGEALAKVREETAGRCNAATYLRAARATSNYLHRFVEWDDAVAAEKHRLDQMRELIACVDIVDEANNNRRLPAFISLIERGGRGYRAIGEVMQSVDLQAAALRQAEDDLRAYERRLQTFVDVCDALRHARELIAQRRADMAGASA